MADQPLIGILGAGGAVGTALARELAAAGGRRLRLGLRRPGAGLVPALDDLRLGDLGLGDLGLGGGVGVARVEVGSARSLAGFCAGCDVVVNCVGALAGSRAAIARSVLAAGSHYVDPGGDEDLRIELAGRPGPLTRTAILGAGVLPGLSGLVSRWLAAGRPSRPGRPARPDRSGGRRVLTIQVATLDRMTAGAAAEFLLSLTESNGESHALWRGGAKVSRALTPLHCHDLPFFPGDVIAYPYLSAEIERIARLCGLDEVRSYQVFEADSRILVTLSRLQQELRQGADPARLAQQLVRAIDVEMFGRRATQQLVFTMEDGEVAGGAPSSRTVLLRARGTYLLTATMTALAVAAVLRADATSAIGPAGVYYAAEVLDPGLIDGLARRPGVAALQILDRPPTGSAQVEHGVESGVEQGAL